MHVPVLPGADGAVVALIVKPYSSPPEPTTIAVALDDDLYLTEHGEIGPLGQSGAGVSVYDDYHRRRRLFHASKRGELFVWQSHAYRYRPVAGGGWQARPGDVYLLRLGDPEPRELLAALIGWRNWIVREGGTVRGSMGSVAFSLLRARLERPWWTRTGETPPVWWTLGGRQELGPAGPGEFTGKIKQYDLSAAYASTLAGTPYGGRWRKLRTSFCRGEWSSSGLPVFVHARIKLSDGLGWGPGKTLPPLPVFGHRGRRRQPRDQWEAMTLVQWWARGRRQGVWAAPELEAALETGACTLDQVLGVWGHFPETGTPLMLWPWWEAVQRGRGELGGVSTLAKQTGNALWGRLAINPHGTRRVAAYSAGKLRRQRLKDKPRKGPLVAPELAEYVAGVVRARLYRALVEAGERLLCAHTDGFWADCSDGWEPSDPLWRVKIETRELRLKDPQTLAYSQRGGWRYLCAGATDAEQTFERIWAEAPAWSRRSPF